MLTSRRIERLHELYTKLNDPVAQERCTDAELNAICDEVYAISDDILTSPGAGIVGVIEHAMGCALLVPPRWKLCRRTPRHCQVAGADRSRIALKMADASVDMARSIWPTVIECRRTLRIYTLRASLSPPMAARDAGCTSPSPRPDPHRVSLGVHCAPGLFFAGR